MGPGVDPHLYKATQGDLKSLTNADVIVYNGLHLEGKMGEIFEKLEKQKHIIVATEGLTKTDYINNTEFQGAQDPHIWFDVALWSKAVQHIGNELIQLSIDSIADQFAKNTEAYRTQLSNLSNQVENELGSLDSNKRILITAHDAFSYFGRAYNFEVKGLQGISTTSEYGLKDVSDLVNYIVDNEIKAVFVESSVSEKSLQAVVEGCLQKNHQVQIGGQLYSDAMGEAGTPEGTYVGMVKHNVKTIVEGLK
tara:strand:- start:585 stop:1337 length:753 start_codon:yes stop_codon:yes gene_type:complete